MRHPDTRTGAMDVRKHIYKFPNGREKSPSPCWPAEPTEVAPFAVVTVVRWPLFGYNRCRCGYAGKSVRSAQMRTLENLLLAFPGSADTAGGKSARGS